MFNHEFANQLKKSFTLLDGQRQWWMIGAVIGSLAVAALDMLGVALMVPLMQLVIGAPTDEGVLGVLADLLRTADRVSLISWVASFVGCAFIAKSLGVIAFRWWLLGHSNTLEVEASTELLRRYLASPYSAHRRRNFGVINRGLATGIGQTFTQVVGAMLSILVDALTIAAIIIVLMLVSPGVTVLSAALFFLITFGIQHFLKKSHRQIGETLAETDIQTWMSFMPAIQGFRETRFSNSASLWLSRYREAKNNRAMATRKLSIISELPKYVLEIGLVLIVGLMAIALFTFSPEMAAQTLGVFAAASTRLMPSLNRVSASLASIRAGKVGLEILVKEIEDMESAPEVALAPSSAKKYSGDIELSHISFAFEDSDTCVLNDVSLKIPEGQTIAFVGSSGAGKSTLLDILLGLLAPTSGEVRVGGQLISNDLPSWYSSFGVVPQDVFLFDDTLRSNVAFGQRESEISNAKLAAALELAHLQDLVRNLPQGLETHLGERGSRISGGQRQRVGIARALYREPKILILDEATSALDNETEYQFSKTLNSLRGRMTIVLVAHRLSTVRDADRVVFLSDGVIKAEGTFDELRQKSAEFSRLVELGKLG